MARNLIKRFNVQKHALEHDETRNEGEILYFFCRFSKKITIFFERVHEKAK